MQLRALCGSLWMALVLAVIVVPCAARDFKPAVAFDEGGRNDHSYNEAASQGADRFQSETGIAYLSGDVAGGGAREDILRGLARQGASIVVAVGFAYAGAIQTVAKEFPDTEFTIVDADLAGPNIQSVTVREQEGSFLVGMLAAMASKSGKIGFIGGLDVPLIRKFAAGYKLGALRVNPQIRVVESTVGTDAHAWNDADHAAVLARDQIAQDADVIYAAAGASGLGVYKAAKDAGKLAIGVDTNQNGLFPGTMLTSMVKRVDTIVYRALKSAQDGTWAPESLSMGLANGAVGWALDDNNRGLVTAAMEQRVNRVAQDIVAGRIQVSDYTER